METNLDDVSHEVRKDLVLLDLLLVVRDLLQHLYKQTKCELL